MREHGKDEEPEDVLSSVTGVVAAFGYEEPHYRGGEAADDVNHEHIPCSVGSRKESPPEMIDRHCCYCYKFELVPR